MQRASVVNGLLTAPRRFCPNLLGKRQGMVRRGFDLIVCLGALCLIGYLVWHALHGQRSYSEAQRIAARIEVLEAERDEVRARRMALDSRVALLRPDSIDPDLVEELARAKLGFVRPSDIIITIDP